MHSSFRSTCLSFGASVVGPYHKAKKMLNEDAWLQASGAFGSLIVISDGVGSCRNARLGAKAVCKAVYDATKNWDNAITLEIYNLSSQIETRWRNYIDPINPKDCMATCLFAICRPNGELIIGGLGDGIAAVKSNLSPARLIIGNRGADFANITLALGGQEDTTKWVLQSVRDYKDAIVMLATDGVSDDLIEDKIDDFLMWMVQEFADMPPIRRWHSIRRELKHWPTPRHTDDKTLAFLLANMKGSVHG